MVGSRTITIAKDDLLAAIYSANPDYEICDKSTPPNCTNTKGQTDKNDVYGAAIRYIIGGFQLGLVGSEVLDPRPGANNTAYKDETSDVWYASNSQSFGNHTGLGKLRATDVFSHAWPDNPTDKIFYNAYAEVIALNSDAYGFPYSDLIFAPLIDIGGLNVNIDTVKITILPDSNTVTEPGPRVPEPSTTFGLLALVTPGAGSVLRRCRISSGFVKKEE